MNSHAPPSVEDIELALSFVPSHDRELWVTIGMAVKSELGQEGFDIWDRWSQSCTTYNERDAQAVWRSFNGNGVTIAVVFHEARSRGYQSGITREVTPRDKKKSEQERVAAAKAAKVEQASKRDLAAAEAQRLSAAATPEKGDHKYLHDKLVKSYGLRARGTELLIPMRDAGGNIHNLQRINPHGRKRFLPDAVVTGHYFAIGAPNNRLIVCEGYATGASIYEATGIATAVAFMCGNLLAVSKVLRDKFPEMAITIAADDDVGTEGNPGRTKADLAALAVNGTVAVPDFGDNRPVGATDFNDMAQLLGNDAVKKRIDAAVAPSQVLSDNQKNESYVSLVCAADITMEPIVWLWQDYLAQGALHIIAGQAGTGKTTIALDIAATISAGDLWPDGSRAPSGDVALWSGEDRAADTLVPRLEAAGADRKRVHFVSDTSDAHGVRLFDPATDLPLLRRQLATLPNLRMLIVDPIVSAVAGDSHKNTEVRRGLQPLVDIAQERGIAVVGISHYSKGGQGKDPLERVTGSIAFGAVARMVFGTGKSAEADGQNVFTKAKCNIAPDGGGFEYSIEVDDVAPGIPGSRIRWGAPLEGTARDILAGCEIDDVDAANEREDAAYWLKQELADGPVAVKELQKRAKNSGHAWTTVKRAKTDASAESDRTAFDGHWRWWIPPTFSQGDHSRARGPLGISNTPKPAPDGPFTEGDHLSNTAVPLGVKAAQGDHAKTEVVPLGETPTAQGFEGGQSPQGDQPVASGPLGSHEAF